jgi:hypothetical protein
MSAAASLAIVAAWVAMMVAYAAMLARSAKT